MILSVSRGRFVIVHTLALPLIISNKHSSSNNNNKSSTILRKNILVLGWIALQHTDNKTRFFWPQGSSHRDSLHLCAILSLLRIHLILSNFLYILHFSSSLFLSTFSSLPPPISSSFLVRPLTVPFLPSSLSFRIIRKLKHNGNRNPESLKFRISRSFPSPRDILCSVLVAKFRSPSPSFSSFYSFFAIFADNSSF